jgi:hypothetical protein
MLFIVLVVVFFFCPLILTSRVVVRVVAVPAPIAAGTSGIFAFVTWLPRSGQAAPIQAISTNLRHRQILQTSHWSKMSLSN